MDNQNQPNLAVQVFLSLCKWFLVVLIINNLIWAGVHFGYFSKSFDTTSINANQDGYYNQQEINGTKS